MKHENRSNGAISFRRAIIKNNGGAGWVKNRHGWWQSRVCI